jgi:hypothetical protein
MRLANFAINEMFGNFLEVVRLAASQEEISPVKSFYYFFFSGSCLSKFYPCMSSNVLWKIIMRSFEKYMPDIFRPLISNCIRK